MSAKHTPGPWRYESGYHDCYDGGHFVVEPVGAEVKHEADARLIAVAPDLLGFARLVAALEDKCRSEGGRCPTYAEWAVLATSIPAIARATGGGK